MPLVLQYRPVCVCVCVSQCDLPVSHFSHSGKTVLLVSHGQGDRLLVSATDTALLREGESDESSSSTPSPVTWEPSPEDEKQHGFRLCLKHSKVLTCTCRILVTYAYSIICCTLKILCTVFMTTRLTTYTCTIVNTLKAGS